MQTIKRKEKMKSNIKQINLTPIGSTLVTTAYLMNTKDSSGIIRGEAKPTFLSVQQVLAVGPRVEDVKVGDWVYIDMQRFVKHVKTKSQVKVGIGGQDMVREEFIPPAFIAPGDDEAYFKITDREIEGVINDYNKLPKDMRDFQTVSSYESQQESLKNQAARDKEAFDKAAAEMNVVKGDDTAVNAPAVFAEGKFRN